MMLLTINNKIYNNNNNISFESFNLKNIFITRIHLIEI